MAFVMTPERQRLLDTGGHLLVLGGPGAGKTAIALRKANRDAHANPLKVGQKILFLSFARATVARVLEHAATAVNREVRAQLEINTYHGWLWKLLKAHGYLLHGPGRIRLIPPPQAAARLAHIRGEALRKAEIQRLLAEDKLLHFDLFAPEGAALLARSQTLCRIICDAYPLIVLDEFQDTNAHEWSVIKTLGQGGSRLVALADAEQRIYEFRGADPRRIQEFSDAFAPEMFDFGNENHRSNGRDITAFGNDLLRGANRGKNYADVEVIEYPFYQRAELYPLKARVLQRLKVLRAGGADWSLAILVPTKQVMLQVSDYLATAAHRLPALPHDVAMDPEGPALAAVVIAGLLEGGATADLVEQRLLADLCEHIRGRRGGDRTPQGELELVDALGKFLKAGQRVRGKNRLRVMTGAKQIAAARMALVLTGDPGQDWLAARRILGESGIPEYVQVADDARYLRLLHKGATLRSRLSELWRDYGGYPNAARELNEALLQEHFSASLREWRGIQVMTIHKSKGKEFTEVIIFERRYQGRLVREDVDEARQAQQRLTLRVAVTRAMTKTTILTPASDPCPLL